MTVSNTPEHDLFPRDLLSLTKHRGMMMDITKCPNCGGYADNGFDRCHPPNPYFCTKCENEHGEIDETP